MRFSFVEILTEVFDTFGFLKTSYNNAFQTYNVLNAIEN